MEQQKDLHTRVVILETQMARIVSDIESEKDTRARANADFRSEFVGVNQHLAKQDRLFNMAMGAILALQILIPILIKVFSK